MGDLIYDYFIRAIDEHSGYNAINTVTYALIALGAAYLILHVLKKSKVKIDEKFILYIIPLILFGSTMRVVTDASGDSNVGIPNKLALNSSYLFGLYGKIASTHVYDYGYLTTTPGIYVIVGLLTFILTLVLQRIRKIKLLPKIGLVLFLIHFIILIPLMKNFSYAFLILVLAVTGSLLGVLVSKFSGIKSNWMQNLLVFSHSLDGAATFVSIELFSEVKYFEQHLLSNMISSVSGSMFFYYLIKVIFAIGVVILLEKSDDMSKEEKNYVYLLLIIFGLAPGVRDLLRLLCGV
jgi:uncharacterized membrane protein